MIFKTVNEMLFLPDIKENNNTDVSEDPRGIVV